MEQWEKCRQSFEKYAEGRFELRWIENDGLKEMYDRIITDLEINPRIFNLEKRKEVYKRWRTGTYKFALEAKKYGRMVRRSYYGKKIKEITDDGARKKNTEV